MFAALYSATAAEKRLNWVSNPPPPAAAIARSSASDGLLLRRLAPLPHPPHHLRPELVVEIEQEDERAVDLRGLPGSPRGQGSVVSRANCVSPIGLLSSGNTFSSIQLAVASDAQLS